MSERDRIERLAKAMGMDIMHGSLVKDNEAEGKYVTIAKDWNPWINSDDLRQVYKFFEGTSSSMLQYMDFMAAVDNLFDDPSEAVANAIRTPRIIADAALEVLEGV